MTINVGEWHRIDIQSFDDDGSVLDSDVTHLPTCTPIPAGDWDGVPVTAGYDCDIDREISDEGFYHLGFTETGAYRARIHGWMTAGSPSTGGPEYDYEIEVERLAEPEVITVKRYRCPFCHRSRAKSQATVEHIGRCWENPQNQTCKTCVNRVDGGAYTCDDPPGCPCGNQPVYACATGLDLGKDGMDIRTGCPSWREAA